jgi:vacuolar protein sorting-associated protein 13A/C
MFEGLVTSILNKYLGQFIENFRESDVNIGILGGDVNLTNLIVKGSGLDFLRLPIKVKYGFVGSLVIKANWRSLSSRPVEIILSDVFVVAGNRTSFQVDEKKDEERALSNKLEWLKTVEDMTLDVESTKENDQDDSYAARTTAAVLDNIQITLNNFHVRYEDTVGIHKNPVALGICIKELSAKTTDSKGDYKFVTNQNVVFKKCLLENFFVYMNFGNKAAHVRSVQELKQAFITFREQEMKFQYLLAPVRATMKIRFNKLESVPGSRVALEIDIANVEFQFREVQYTSLIEIFATLAKAAVENSLIKESFHNRYREGTDEERLTYFQLYRRTLNCHWEAKLTEAEVKQMQALEVSTAQHF